MKWSQGSVTKMLSKLSETSMLDECLPCRITKLSSYASSVTFVHPRWIAGASRRILARSSSAASCWRPQRKPRAGLVIWRRQVCRPELCELRPPTRPSSWHHYSAARNLQKNSISQSINQASRFLTAHWHIKCIYGQISYKRMTRYK